MIPNAVALVLLFGAMGHWGVPIDMGSAIVAPSGKYLAGPLYDKEETLYAEIDLELAIREKHSRDVAGHYARPDVLQLVVNRRPKPVAHFVESGHAAAAAHAAQATAADRLETVREYLDHLIQSIGANGDTEINDALVEALASIDMAAETSDASIKRLVSASTSDPMAAIR